MTYKVEVLPPEEIYIYGGPIAAFDSMAGYRKHGEGCVISFTKENTLLIRHYLAGKDFKIDDRNRQLLKDMADLPEELLENYTWETGLLELKQNKIDKKYGKIKTEWDLLHYLPLRYIDKSNPQNVGDLELNQWAVVVGTIANDPKWDNVRNLVKIVVQDAKGKRISATFFRQKWLAWQFKHEEAVVLYGNYSEYVDHKGGRFPQITNAKIDKLNNLRGELPMIPIYPQKSGDKSWQLQKDIGDLINHIGWISDPVPERILKKFELMSRNDAYKKVHFPANKEEAEKARERIAFDEFIRLQILFHNKRSHVEQHKSKEKHDVNLASALKSSIPYQFTGAQERVIKELREDLSQPIPMHRLLQGDVGSGKSIIALYSMLIAVGSGQQVALLAPTDILASQLKDRFESDLINADLHDVRLELLRGKMPAKEKREILRKLAEGEIDILVGTHAIIQPSVVFKDLGMVVVDEQHKFGIEQRSALRVPTVDGFMPDMLIMSATPIPRTTSQVVYGDMDISIIDELPAGRKPIETHWIKSPKGAYERIEQQLKLGRQAYVIASLVEESEKLEDISSAVETFEELSLKVFPNYTVGLMHGRLAAEDKQKVMDDFVSGKTQILVSTTVIEVGVNVPNATVMAILNANRFGISSLHQMRGRVGRGADESFCYLVGETTTPEAEERLNAMVLSTDGFWLAEKDLEIRGEGTLFGSLQSGGSDMFIGNLREHKHILEDAKSVAKQACSSKVLQDEVNELFKDKIIGS